MSDIVVERYTMTKGGDSFTVEILADGTIKSTTGAVGAQNHQNAEGFFSMIARLTGGKLSIFRRGDHAHAKHTHSQNVTN